MDIIKQTSNILYASSVSGVGFSIGRDLYKNFKKNWWIILIIISAIISVLMLFIIGLWVGRNYKNIFIGFIKKTATILMLPFFYLFNLIILNLVVLFIDKLLLSGSIGSRIINEYVLFKIINQNLVQPLSLFLEENNVTSAYFNEYKFLLESTYTDFTNLLILILICVGLFVGILQRKKRKLMWAAENHNFNFINKLEFSEIEKYIYRDKDFQEYRLENVLRDYLEFMPEGKRGKRAYISIDNKGCYKDWSGIIKIDDKAAFLKNSLQS